ncbi:DUF3038 domain-containing protein [Aphanothece sacrum]|uniref:DUF3038 domain-containing protein n=1 Tax=Aphanothece sacrum FPU1 TaxID=1920663 RepID=A0A401IEM1_APHSA|nr:DUF3038 domain-containing protein [Aphanothece sacrum]GBF79676.1 hypothetical protein AsFPU1_1075 [Aphanothece sacrum FPU1]GBF87136.1 hypothetical protein AsFPU3_4218 [Aphanothece sacrum FPU3]
MNNTAINPSLVPYWEDLTLSHAPTGLKLDQIQIHLDLVLLALEALTNLNSESLLATAQELNISMSIAQTFNLWRECILNPSLNNGRSGKKLQLEQARGQVLLICHLAQQNQEFIRRAVTLLEQVTFQDKDPYRTTLLGNYIEKFNDLYQGCIPPSESLSPSQLSKLASKLLVDLLFYSAPNGHRRLWIALLDYTR